MKPISPLVWRSAGPNAAFSATAVRIATGDDERCPPLFVRASAFQAATDASVNQTIKTTR